ncbi:Wall-associated receptor kinase, galacturonan-binding domain containing protein [Trema orientale]|uniref:Wall-associated receptor kinase, galacturonan-binding domain containing protein n=1 Tax=Trema orientale TaxID=63057 RepID=A0A2P5DWI3_TREOI|nr:Wall-associated receptor kinase, galacturonan-binding domain containing protein [Trema orientale]
MIMNLIPRSFMLILLLLSSTNILIISEKALAVVVKKPGHNCQKRCGGISIEYPFGIGPDCYRHKSYSIICQKTFDSSKPKPFIESINLEVLNISVQDSKIKVNSPVLSSCTKNGSTGPVVVDLSDVPFWFSGTSNKFAAVGCDNLALLTANDTILGGCMSYCNNNNNNNNGVLNGSVSRRGGGAGGCYGLERCQTTNPSPLKVLNVSFRGVKKGEEGCSYAGMVEHKWFESNLEQNIYGIEGMEYVPAVLNWVVVMDDDYGINSTWGINSTLGDLRRTLCGPNAQYINSTTSSTLSQNYSYVCVCPEGYGRKSLSRMSR